MAAKMPRRISIVFFVNLEIQTQFSQNKMSDNTVYGHALNRVLIDDNTLITLQNSYLLEIQSRGYFDGYEPGTDGIF
jgi:hypothetical protein